MVSKIQLSAVVKIMLSLVANLKYMSFTSVNAPFLQTIPSYHSRPNLPILNSFPLSPTGGYFTENR